jgi:hypothetical protein
MSSGRIRSALRAAAAAHQPDRAAILARIQRGQAAADAAQAPRSTRRRTAVAAGMAATVAAVLGLSVAVTWAAVRGEPTREAVPAAPATVTPAPTAAPTIDSSAAARPLPSHPRTGRPPSTPQASRPPVASPGDASVQQGFLWSSGGVDPHSIDNWAQSNVTIRNAEIVTTLELRVRIALTPSMANTGAWSTISADNLVTSVERQPDALVYTFTLKPGVRLAPASHMFAVQYGHAPGGRDPGRDSYQAIATTQDGTRAEVSGGF